MQILFVRMALLFVFNIFKESNHLKTSKMKKLISALFIILWTTSTQAQTPTESNETTFYFIRHVKKILQIQRV